MDKILVATDLSERSDHALRRALALAGQFGAELGVLHVVDDELPVEIVDTLRTAAEDKLNGHLKDLPEDLGERTTLRVEPGEPVEQIIDTAWSTQADLIVIGLHRRRWVRDLVLGATLERLLRLCDRPVLVVREAASAPYRRVLVAVDFSIGSRRAYEAGVRLAPEARFQLVHAYDTPFSFLTSRGSQVEAATQHANALERMVEQELQTLAGRLPAGAPKPELVLVRGEPTGAILDQVAKQRPDLLALGTHGRTGVARAVLGSVARTLLQDPPCDVLAVRGW